MSLFYCVPSACVSNFKSPQSPFMGLKNMYYLVPFTVAVRLLFLSAYGVPISGETVGRGLKALPFTAFACAETLSWRLIGK